MYIAHGKKDLSETHSVEQHSEEAAKIAKKAGAPVKMESICYLSALLHDMGKFAKLFQDYIIESINSEKKVQKETVNHSSAGAYYVHRKFHKGKPVQNLTSQLISYAISAHHGIYDMINNSADSVFETRVVNREDAFEAMEIYHKEFENEEELKHCFDKAEEEVRHIIQTINTMRNTRIHNDFYLSLLTRFILSTVIDGDWESTYQFMSGDIKEQNYNYKELWGRLIRKMEQHMKGFSGEGEMNQLRKAVSEECLAFAKQKPGIYQLPSATGAGKTLASFRFALHHAEEYKKKRIIYIAPYRSVLEQNSGVIRKIINDDTLVLEHHSNIIPENAEEYQYLSGRWNSPIIFTTMVQFLNTLFSDSRQSIRRFHSLSESVIIVDEVQSIPVKCIHMFNLAMNFLSKICGATIVLCSATQPLLDQVDFPILFNEPKSMIKDIHRHFEQFSRVDIINEYTDAGYSNEMAGDFLWEKAMKFDSVLLIVNTKNAVHDIFEHVKEKVKGFDETIYLFSMTTDMCPGHRADVLSIIKEKLGKERIICISTPLMEAGVDISFRCVIRSLAGLDSIIQAAGRCNRNGGSIRGYVYIINLNQESLKNLPDIQIGQTSVISMLDDVSIAGKDMASPEIVNRYYNKYFFARKEDMSYSISKSEGTILELLSENKVKCEDYYMKHGKKIPYILNQSFKTAGENFEVIDSNTTGIIVPYGDGERIIADLNSLKSNDVKSLRELLKQAQRFSVNVYENKLMKLKQENALIPISDGCAYVLKDGFYSGETGITFNKKLEFREV